MKTETFLRKLSVVLTAAILIVGVAACAHHKATEGTDYGQVRTEASTTQSTSSEVVGTAPAPANAQGVEGATTPAIISGPAKVDNTGRAYTSSAQGSTGNASGTGLNTNVNIIPEKSTSNVTVTQSPAVSTTETTTQTTVATTTPAPTVVETTPAPAPIVTETKTTTTEVAPMTSATTQETTTTTTETTTHKRMRKD